MVADHQGGGRAGGVSAKRKAWTYEAAWVHRGTRRRGGYIQVSLTSSLTAHSLRVTIAGHEVAAMPSGPGERYDFFLSRRGSVATIAQEVTDVLTEKGYKVFVQDYDIPITANFIEEMHEAVKNARDLVVLFTRDYEQSPYTRMEFTSFEANAAQSAEKRRMVILRCEDAPLLGLFAPHVYQDLVGIGDAEERRSRILAAAEGRSQALEPPPRPFIGVPPRIASFTGRADELDRLDAILMQDKPAAVTQASVGRAAVQGMGGVGKTSLAIEYAHRFEVSMRACVGVQPRRARGS